MSGWAVVVVLWTAAVTIAWHVPWWVTGAAVAAWVVVNEWRIRRHNKIDIPAPPPGSERGWSEKRLVTASEHSYIIRTREREGAPGHDVDSTLLREDRE